MASFCHLDYDQLKEDCIKKLNGVVKTQQQNGTQNEAAKNTYTNGIHKAHKNGVKCKDLWLELTFSLLASKCGLPTSSFEISSSEHHQTIIIGHNIFIWMN